MRTRTYVLLRWLFVLATLSLLELKPPLAAARIAYRPSVSSLQAASNAHKGKVSLAHAIFASGNRQSSDQVFWEDVVRKVIESQPTRFAATSENATAEGSSRRTDMLLWTGNAVYADISDAGVELVKPRPPQEIEKQYQLLSRNTYYANFVDRVVGRHNVVGVWDEHDMGLRHGAEKKYSQAHEVRDIYLRNILNGRKDIKEQLEQHQGLYYFTTIPSPQGSALADVYKNAVCVVALDVVSLRDPYPNFSDSLLTPFSSRGRALGAAKKVKDLPAADVLGNDQWVWLEDIIQTYVAPKHIHRDAVDATGEREKEECALTVFASAWQVLLNDNKPFTGWDLFPAARTRLLAMLKNYEASRFLFLSGHAELAEIGGITATPDADVEQKRSTGIMGMYARNNPITPLTKYGRKLLPFVTSTHSSNDGVRTQVNENGGRASASMESFYTANGLVEATSSGLTHSITNAPFVGRIASWLVDGDTSTNTLSYNPEELLRQDRRKTLDEGGKDAGFRFMSRYLSVGRVVKPRRNIGTLQLLTSPAAAKDFATNTAEVERTPRSAHVMKSVREEDDPRLAGYGNGPAAAKAFVDDNVKVVIALHATDDGSTLLMYEASLAQLPSYRRPLEAADAEGGTKEGMKGKAHFVDYTELPPFSIYNIPGEFPTIKRSILSSGCAEVPCIHGKYFMIGKTVFILAIAFVILMILAAVIIAVLLFTEDRKAVREERKLKKE